MILDEGTCTYRDTSVAPGYVPFLTFQGRLSIFVEILIFCEILWNLVRSCYFSLRLWFCKCLQLSCFHFSQEWLRVCEVLRQKCWLSVIITTFHNKNVFFVKSCEILRFFVRDWLTVYMYIHWNTCISLIFLSVWSNINANGAFTHVSNFTSNCNFVQLFGVCGV